jgi:predicted transposase/invertase (TIGR01784 family)
VQHERRSGAAAVLFRTFAVKFRSMKFADIKNDVAFRKIFGNKKKTNILISFLNAVLQLEGKQRIASVKIENPYQFPRLAGEKSSIIDVRATEESGRQFVIEMQVSEPDGFDKRVQYYASRDYSMQIDKGEDYVKLKPTVFIGILDFSYFKGDDYLSYHSLLDEKTHENKLKDIRFAFIELTKFKKKEQELESPMDKWTFFIKNAPKLAVIPDNVDDEGLREAYLDADRHQWKKAELIAYDNASMAEQDEKGKLTAAEKRGERKKEVEAVLGMFANGISVSIIAKSLQLTEARVNQIIGTQGSK